MTKIKIKTLEVAGFASAVQALRLPFGKQCRSKASTKMIVDEEGVIENPHVGYTALVDFDEKDLHLMSVLIKRGDEHAKVVRGIVAYAEIEAPIWFYRELETYRFGRERLSCESTMHIECRGLGGEELEKAKDEISMGHIQKTADMFSYQTLRRIYIQRRHHRLTMWHDFCRWIESLPFAKQLILVGLEEDGSQDNN
jgi:hypothetical protein